MYRLEGMLGIGVCVYLCSKWPIKPTRTRPRKKMNEVLAKKAGKGNVLSDCSTKPKERLDEIGMRIAMKK